MPKDAMKLHPLFLVLPVIQACAPPPAPEGLDDSMRYILREFYESDAVVSSGLSGLMTWFDQEGFALLNESADLDNVGAFSLSGLDDDDVSALELDDGRDLSMAAGIVSIAEMGCSWKETEALYVREDQMAVFEGNYTNYTREYESSLDNFLDATSTDSFPAVTKDIDPDDVLGDLSGAMLYTKNRVTTETIGITIEAPMNIHFRHGEFDINGEQRAASIVMGYATEKAISADGDNALVQSYSLVINIETQDNKTLRLFTIWNELDFLFESDAPIVLMTAVNQSQDAAVRLSSICTGDITLAENG